MSVRQRAFAFFIGLMALVLSSGCGNGGSAPPAAPVPAPSGLTYSSGTATYTRTFAITQNSPTVTGTVTSYSVSPALPAGLTLNTTTGVISGTPTDVVTSAVYTVTATNAGGSTTANVTITVRPYLVFTNGQAANFAIGQTDLDSSAAAQTQNGMTGPYGNTAIDNGKLYVGGDSRRIVTYALPITANGPNAVNVIGQDDFSSSAFGTTANRFDYPGSASISGGKLFVADWNNRRVVIFNTIPTTDGASADVVVGQAAFGAPTTLCDATHYNNSIEGVSAANGRLVVADKFHHRVLVYNTIPTANGAAADLVLGQADFVSCTANRGATAAANTLNIPIGVWTDGTRIVVTDNQNRRVLIWNIWPTTNGQAADVVLGQSDFTSTVTGTTDTTVNNPYHVSSNGTQLFLADGDNNRALIWNSWPTTNGQAADRVLGQPDFITGTSGTSATTLSFPGGFSHDTTRLYVNDYSNNRILVFTSQ